MFVVLQSMLFLILRGIELLWNKISFVVAIRGRVSHFLLLHFVTFVLFSATCLVLSEFSE